MKKITFLVILLSLGFVNLANAHGNTALGIQLGQPTGLSGKFWLDTRSAIDATFGWNVSYNYVALQAGYLYHFPLGVRTGTLNAYVGIGGLVDVWGATGSSNGGIRFSARIPLGLEYIYNPISFYAELDPLMVLIPGTNFEMAGGIGFRYYF